MIYLTGCTNKKMAKHLDDQTIGFLNTPTTAKIVGSRWIWAADNGCYGASYVGDEAWYSWLIKMAPQASTCLFATAPDVVGDGAATLTRSLPWLPLIRGLGFPAALVAQDGMTETTIPWGDFDVLFVGGTTEWKLGSEVRQIIAGAHAQGVDVHAGRVNSWRRFHYFDSLGVRSADGNYIAFGPDQNLPAVLSWVERSKTHLRLWEA